MEIIALVLLLILEVAVIIGKLEVFSKAGYKWWIGFIPIYSSWILITKVAKIAWYWFILDLVVFIISCFVENSIILKVFDFAIVFCICYNIAKLFNKKPVINGIIGGIFTGFWLVSIGFDKKAVYDNNIVVSPNGPFGA